MQYKQSAAEFYAPSVRELQHAQRNSKGLANLLLAALGISAAGYGSRYLFEDLAASRLSNDIQPSVDLQRKLRLVKNKIDNEYLYNTEEEKHPFTAEEVAELKRLAEESQEKKAGIDIPFNLEVGSKTPAKSDITQNVLESALLNRRSGKFKDHPAELDLNKVLNYPDKELASKLHYDPKSLASSSWWTNNISNALAKLGPQSALPLGLVGGAGIMAAPLLAKALVGKISKMLPKPKRESKFLDAAREIYDEAAQELQDAGYKKEKDENKRKKEGSLKIAKKKGGPTIATEAVEGNPLLNVANLPTGIVAALLAYAAYKGVRGFGTGLDRAKNDLSHKTQFLRGWNAMNKLRDYNYNPITAELEEEPGLKTRTMREKDKRVRELLEDLKDSDEIEYNPIEIQRLTSDYSKLV